MNNQTVSQLLEKYRTEGLSPDEVTLLESLTDKEQVVGRATRRAATLRRGRTAVLSTVLVAVAGVGVWMLHAPAAVPLYTDNQPMPVAVPDALPTAAPAEVEPATTVEYAAYQPAHSEPIATPANVADKAAEGSAAGQQPLPASRLNDLPNHIPASTSAPTASKVYCNNQCEADSVIDNIRKFLMA